MKYWKNIFLFLGKVLLVSFLIITAIFWVPLLELHKIGKGKGFIK